MTQPPPFTACPKCGTKSNPAARFCQECGTPFGIVVRPPASNQTSLIVAVGIVGFFACLMIGIFLVGLSSNETSPPTTSTPAPTGGAPSTPTPAPTSPSPTSPPSGGAPGGSLTSKLDAAQAYLKEVKGITEKMKPSLDDIKAIRKELEASTGSPASAIQMQKLADDISVVEAGKAAAMALHPPEGTEHFGELYSQMVDAELVYDRLIQKDARAGVSFNTDSDLSKADDERERLAHEIGDEMDALLLKLIP